MFEMLTVTGVNTLTDRYGNVAQQKCRIIETQYPEP